MPKAPKSLVVSRGSTASSQCSLSVLPCHISHTGPVDASSRYWRPTADADDGLLATSYFRGRKLRGRRVAVPEGYEGMVLKKTDRTMVLPTDIAAEEDDAVEDGDADEAREEAAEELQIADRVATFKHITIWNHETLPDRDEDVHIKGLTEWISFAEAVSKSPLCWAMTILS